MPSSGRSRRLRCSRIWNSSAIRVSLMLALHPIPLAHSLIYSKASDNHANMPVRPLYPRLFRPHRASSALGSTARHLECGPARSRSTRDVTVHSRTATTTDAADPRLTQARPPPHRRAKLEWPRSPRCAWLSAPHNTLVGRPAAPSVPGGLSGNLWCSVCWSFVNLALLVRFELGICRDVGRPSRLFVLPTLSTNASTSTVPTGR